MSSISHGSDSSASFPADEELESVVSALLHVDPSGQRFARVFRETFDQLYDGQRTGRYKWEQLYKTEKTHFGTLIEINLQREFAFDDGVILDYRIAGVEVDCKYSFRDGGWMLPPESWGLIVLVAIANDEHSTWSIGVVRATDDHRRTSVNRDGKTTLNQDGRLAIRWIFRSAGFSPNVLLQLADEDVALIFEAKTGQGRLDQLFRLAQERRIHRNTIATVAQQQDYMKRVRANGGSRSNLQAEGFLIPGGDYAAHRRVAAQFGVPIPEPGEVVSFRVAPAGPDDPIAVKLEGRLWRRASQDETLVVPAPVLHTAKRTDASEREQPWSAD